MASHNSQRRAMGYPPYEEYEKAMNRRDREYEYRVETIPVLTKAADVEARLTAFGVCGWQLVHVQGDRYFFERPR